MTTAEQILVVFLSTALAVFLVIAIVAAVQAVKLLKTMRRIADKAESFVNSAEAVGQMVGQTVGAVSISKIMKGIINFAHKKQQEQKGGDSNERRR